MAKRNEDTVRAQTESMAGWHIPPSELLVTFTTKCSMPTGKAYN